MTMRPIRPKPPYDRPAETSTYALGVLVRGHFNREPVTAEQAKAIGITDDLDNLQRVGLVDKFGDEYWLSIRARGIHRDPGLWPFSRARYSLVINKDITVSLTDDEVRMAEYKISPAKDFHSPQA